MATTMAAAGARFRAIRRGDGLRSRRCVVASAVRDSRRDVRTRAGRETRLDVQAVIPMLQGDATEQTPPDLPSFLFKNRIVYLGMSFVPSVTELVLAELLYLQYEDEKKPIFLYVNSTGTTKGAQKLAYDTEAFAIYDTMRYVKPPIHTLCVGTAWGEAAMLLAAGEPGKRASLPSASIMIKEPIQLFRGQATDIDIKRQEVRNTKEEVVALLSKHTEHPKEKIAKDIQRPFYMSPEEAVEYNLIDEVLYAQNASDVVKMVTKVDAGL